MKRTQRRQGEVEVERDALPAEVEAVIARVVRRARLGRGEREDVAKELRTHFAEGMRDGKSAQEMVAEFGDAKAAGKMIGRAKRRCRGVVWHAWVWSCRGVAGMFVVLVVMYALSAWAYYGGAPTITRNYMAEMNARVEAIPEEDRAWPLYKQAILGIPYADVDRMWELYYYDSDDGEVEWVEHRALLEKHGDAIDLLVEAGDRPEFGYTTTLETDERIRQWNGWEKGRPIRWAGDPDNPPLIGLGIERWGFARSMGMILRCEARRAIAEGDAERWERALISGFRLAQHVGTSESTLGYLVGIGIDAMFMNAVGRGLALEPQSISDDTMIRIARALEANEAWMRVIPYEGYRIEAEDFVQRIYNDATGRITASGIESVVRYFQLASELNKVEYQILRPSKVAGPLTGLVMASKKEVLKRAEWIQDECERWAETPLLERPEHPVWNWIGGELDSSLGEMRWWPLESMTTSAMGMVNIRDDWMLKSAGVRTAIAIDRYRRARGGLPAELAQLVPEFLAEVPIDIYSGEALRYIVRDGVPIVYSVGCDMDDDGGREPTKRMGRFAVSTATFGPPREREPEWWTEEKIREYDGDWILWPPVHGETGELVVKGRGEEE